MASEEERARTDFDIYKLRNRYTDIITRLFTENKSAFKEINIDQSLNLMMQVLNKELIKEVNMIHVFLENTKKIEAEVNYAKNLTEEEKKDLIRYFSQQASFA